MVIYPFVGHNLMSKLVGLQKIMEDMDQISQFNCACDRCTKDCIQKQDATCLPKQHPWPAFGSRLLICGWGNVIKQWQCNMACCSPEAGKRAVLRTVWHIHFGAICRSSLETGLQHPYNGNAKSICTPGLQASHQNGNHKLLRVTCRWMLKALSFLHN